MLRIVSVCAGCHSAGAASGTDTVAPGIPGVVADGTNAEGNSKAFRERKDPSVCQTAA
jgi:hypothetical protein